MAFFDEAGRKIKEAGQDVSRTTKNLTSSVKLSSAIAEEEKNVTRLYCAIGQEYFALHGDEPEESIAPHVESLKAAKAHIEECKAQLLKIKGLMLCPGCGAEIAESSVFCNFCGMKLPERSVTEEHEEGEDPEPLRCVHCGAELAPNSRFCIVCGGAVPQSSEKAPAVDEHISEAPAAPSAKPYPTMKASDHLEGKPHPTFVASELAAESAAVCEECASCIEQPSVDEVIEKAEEATEAAIAEVSEAADAVGDEIAEQIKDASALIAEDVLAAPELDFEKLCAEAETEAKEAPEKHGSPLTEEEIKQAIDDKAAEITEPVKQAEEKLGLPQGAIFPIGYDPGAKAPEPAKEPDHMLDGPGSEMPLRCAKCGAELKPSQKFCTMCGERIAQAVKQDVKLCHVCGAELKAGQKFCTSCGSRTGN